MFRLPSILLLAVAAWTGSPIASQTLEGYHAKITDFPYMASVELSGTGHYCGAVIVSPHWALTDAWCASQPVDVDDFALRSGSAVLDNGQLHRVLRWIHHPDSHVFYSEYDFALVQVEPPFEFGENVAVVTLPEQDEVTPDDAEGHFVGWVLGYTSGKITKSLQYVNTSVFGDIRCSEYLASNYSESKLCVKNHGEQVAFWNEEGGPLVVDGKLFGIAQWSGDCVHPCEVKVFSRVASVRDWIDHTLAG